MIALSLPLFPGMIPGGLCAQSGLTLLGRGGTLMDVNVQLTPELEELVQSKVKSGRYSSASEVVRQALLLLEQLDEDFTHRKDEIREQIEEGWQSAKRGELVDGDEVFDRIEAELEAMERSAGK